MEEESRFAIMTTIDKIPETSFAIPRRYADETDFHGFRELAAAKPVAWRIYWGVILCYTFVFTVYVMTQTFAGYQIQHVRTEIKSFSPAYFPAIMYCPIDWADRDKCRTYNVTPDDIRAFVTVTRGGSGHASRVTREMFLETANKPFFVNRTVREAFMDLSPEIEKVLTASWGVPFFGNRTSFLKIPANKEVCYIASPITDVESVNKLKWQALHLDLAIPEQFVRLNENPFLNDVSFMLGINDGNSTATFLPFPNGEDYFIKFILRRTITYPTRMEPCDVEITANDHALCSARFLDQLCTQAGKLPIYAPAEASPMDAPLINTSSTMVPETDCRQFLFTGEASATYDSSDLKRSLDTIDRECPKPCSYQFYTPTVVPIGKLGNAPDNVTKIVLSFFDPVNSWQFREVPAVSPDSVLNQLGGGLSLWLGGSIISVFHLTYFIGYNFCENFNGKRRQHESQQQSQIEIR